MICYVVLDRGTVSYCVDRTEWCAVETKVGICFECMLIRLNFEFCGYGFGEIGVC